jgi:putative membrane protein
VTLLVLILAALAGLLHVFIFILESLRWEEPATRKTFGTTPEQAAMTKQLAYNQGFYNLFLALGIVVGLVLVTNGSVEAGRAVVVFACACMVLAGVVLITTSRAMLRAALLQAVPPALAIIAAFVL